MSLGVSLTIQSVSATPTISGQNDFCQKFPKVCKNILNWCDRHPEACEKVSTKPIKPIIVIPPPPNCPGCPEKVIVDLNPFDLILLGQLNNNTIAVKVSPQDVLNMLSNVTSMTNASATAK